MPEPIETQSNRSKLPPRGWTKARRHNAFQAPPPSGWRRVRDRLLNRWTLGALSILVVGSFLAFTYFWFEFSDRIDRRLLAGEVFTRSAGIYSAPKTLRVDEPISLQGLVDYLKSAGYVEKNDRADPSRSRYVIEGNVLAIEPGFTGVIDGKRVFPALSVKFKKALKSVDRIGNRDTGSEDGQARLEPKILSSIAAEKDGRRKTIAFADIPLQLIKAITVTEDRSFFEHYGVNVRGIARALWRRYDGDDDGPLSNQGGSSITQQLVKNLILSNEQTLTRKATEAFMSVILETRLTKEEIFTLYVNQIYLGQQQGVSIYGAGEAADAYFGKDVSQLTLSESAFLAGIIRSPNRYNPYKNIEKVTERRNQILDSMREAGELDDTQLAVAREIPITLKQVIGRKELQAMPYFSQYVVEQLPNVVSDPDALQHLRVYTSIDPDLQQAAYDIVTKRLAALDKFFPKKPKGSLNAALIAIRPKTGEIVAMVGGRDYQQNQFNRATDAMRQPGSVFKPFVYAAAINSAYDSGSRVFTAASVFRDEKKTFTFDQNSYKPGNFGDSFSNQETTLRDALVKSKNVITVDLAMQLNIGKVMNFAAKAGLPKVDKAYPSMALGTAEATPLSIATAYTIFANMGDRVMPMPITQVTGGDGRTVNAPSPDKKNVIRPDVAYVMNDIMKDVINRGTAAKVQGWGFHNVAGQTAFAGKTGTSRDGWFAGFTPELVCVVYVGFDGGDDLGMKGSDSAMPIWADFMKEALRSHPDWNGDWAMPMGVRKAEIDIRNGSVVRELDAMEAAATAKPAPTPTIERATLNIEGYEEELPADDKEIYVTNIPAEFRRVELFIAGTVPNRMLVPSVDETLESSAESPAASPTPIESTWEETGQGSDTPATELRRKSQRETTGSITIMICPTTELRATISCPTKQPRTFAPGDEPSDFCPFHR